MLYLNCRRLRNSVRADRRRPSGGGIAARLTGDSRPPDGRCRRNPKADKRQCHSGQIL